MILIAAATAAELPALDRADVRLLVTGIGVAEAATRVASALALQRFDLVVNAGIAGTFERSDRIGEGVIVAEDVFELGRETGTLALPPGVSIVDRATSDTEIVRRLTGRGYRSVRGITVSRVTTTAPTAERLRSMGAQIETMEGFAVLRAAAIAGVRAVQVRGISNYAGTNCDAAWDFAAGRDAAVELLSALLQIESAVA